SRRRHTRLQGDWSSDVCSSDLMNEFRKGVAALMPGTAPASAPAAMAAPAPKPAPKPAAEKPARPAKPAAKKGAVKSAAAGRSKRSEERRVGKECRHGNEQYQ